MWLCLCFPPAPTLGSTPSHLSIPTCSQTHELWGRPFPPPALCLSFPLPSRANGYPQARTWLASPGLIPSQLPHRWLRRLESLLPRGWETRPQCGLCLCCEEPGPVHPLLSFIFIWCPRAAGISPATVPSPPAEDAASCQGTRGSFLLRSPAGKALPQAGTVSMRSGCCRLWSPAKGQRGS